MSRIKSNWLRNTIFVILVIVFLHWGFSLWRKGTFSVQLRVNHTTDPLLATEEGKVLRVHTNESWQPPPKVASNTSSKVASNHGFSTREEGPSSNSSCNPKQRVVFIKTHKTGSSTINTMIFRYGYRRDLNFALPPKTHLFSQFEKFKASDAFQYDLRDGNGTPVWPALGGFNFFANHAQYNRPEQDKVIPNAVYFTILREPAYQLESTIDFYSLSRLKMTEIFQTDPKKYLSADRAHPVRNFAWNGQMYDLGVDKKINDNPKAVNDTIELLSKELDLVMITEYFDESLILLKKLLCWDFDDIVYLAKRVRKSSGRRSFTEDLLNKIHKWNQADLMLYQHFNKTFWQKVQSYGPSFQRDLETFRELQGATVKKCLENATVRMGAHTIGTFKLPPNSSEKCQDLVRSEEQWTPMIRKRMAKKSSAFMEKRTGQR